MIISDFLNLDFESEQASGVMPVESRNCTALGFLYGGAALATSIETMEHLSGRPLIWASTQFANFANANETLEIDANLANHGRNISHLNLSAKVNKNIVFQSIGSCGSRASETETQWAQMPNVDSPENCPDFGSGAFKGNKDCIDKRLKFKVAKGNLRKDKPTDDQMMLWAKVPELDKMSATSLALMADYLPVGAGSMLKMPAGGNSLDNSLRVLKLEESEWVLCESDVRGVQNGIGHATMNLWSQSGNLLAVASQSFVFRIFDLKK